VTSYIRLDGTSGSYASTPDVAALDITGDIDVRADVACDDWTPASASIIVGKFHTTGNQRSWRFDVASTGRLQFIWSVDGSSTTNTLQSTVGPTVSDGGRICVRVAFDVNNGASGRTATFYTATSMNGPWTQLGDPATSATATSIFSSTANLEVGSRNDGTANLLTANVYAVQVRNGIGGTVVANPIFAAAYPGQNELTDSTGKLWTWATADTEDDGETAVGSVEGLQDAAQTHWGLDLNGALRAATGLNKDANGISRSLWGRDLYQARRQALALLEGGGGQATPPP
jgi:hypothetical protein